MGVYSNNDLLDLELHYSKALVRDDDVLQLIEYVKELHAIIEINEDIEEKLDNAEEEIVKLKEDAAGSEDKIKDLEATIARLEDELEETDKQPEEKAVKKCVKATSKRTSSKR